MSKIKHETKSKWESVSQSFKNQKPIRLGPYSSQCFYKTPQKMLTFLSDYKFTAKLIGEEKRVLEVGCNEGLGTYLIAKECGFAKGIDTNKSAIQSARNNFHGKNIEFEFCVDILRYQQELNKWDAVVCFETTDNFSQKKFGEFLECFSKSITPEGLIVVCVPCRASNLNASNDVNQLKSKIGSLFTHVFIFSAYDEVIHAGYSSLSNRLLTVACKKKTEKIFGEIISKHRPSPRD